MDTIAGIDYGSKLAGTTVVAWAEEGQIKWQQSAKKMDADRFLLDWAQAVRPARLFLDAPLSLPGVYRQPEAYSDYFYRAGDRELRAMSPMFLGGLTARAMQLQAKLAPLGCEVFETYPAQLSRHLALDAMRYKKDKAYLTEAAQLLLNHLPKLPLQALPANWHQFDALLAYCSAYRYAQGKAVSFGVPEEGCIWV